MFFSHRFSEDRSRHITPQIQKDRSAKRKGKVQVRYFKYDPFHARNFFAEAGIKRHEFGLVI
jgi:CRISPR/Cas system-associated protein Csx1